MNVYDLIELGSFDVTSGVIIFSDPCYTRRGYGMDSALNGKWNAYVEYSDEGAWGIRVKSLTACHESIKTSNLTLYMGMFSVDSGQFGFFNANKYNAGIGEDQPLDEDWFESICEITSTDEKAGIVEGGCVSCTGFGDGLYSVYAQKDSNGYIVALRILFIEDEEDEEDEDYENEEEGSYE